MANKVKQDEDDLDISSLIDIVFLLIMFFVVTANLDREQYDDRVKLAECKFLKPEIKAIAKSIVVNILSDGRFTISRRILTKDQLKNKLAKAKDTHGNDLSVVIRLDRDGSYEYTDVVKEIVQKLKLKKIRLVSERQN